MRSFTLTGRFRAHSGPFALSRRRWFLRVLRGGRRSASPRPSSRRRRRSALRGRPHRGEHRGQARRCARAIGSEMRASGVLASLSVHNVSSATFEVRERMVGAVGDDLPVAAVHSIDELPPGSHPETIPTPSYIGSSRPSLRTRTCHLGLSILAAPDHSPYPALGTSARESTVRRGPDRRRPGRRRSPSVRVSRVSRSFGGSCPLVVLVWSSWTPSARWATVNDCYNSVARPPWPARRGTLGSALVSVHPVPRHPRMTPPFVRSASTQVAISDHSPNVARRLGDLACRPLEMPRLCSAPAISSVAARSERRSAPAHGLSVGSSSACFPTGRVNEEKATSEVVARPSLKRCHSPTATVSMACNRA